MTVFWLLCQPPPPYTTFLTTSPLTYRKYSNSKCELSFFSHYKSYMTIWTNPPTPYDGTLTVWALPSPWSVIWYLNIPFLNKESILEYYKVDCHYSESLCFRLICYLHLWENEGRYHKIQNLIATNVLQQVETQFSFLCLSFFLLIITFSSIKHKYIMPLPALSNLLPNVNRLILLFSIKERDQWRIKS